MCFYNGDYDWYAETTVAQDKVSDKERKCLECRAVIAVGDTYHDIWMQEREECRTCCGWDDDWEEEVHCNCPKNSEGRCTECKCEAPDFGETYQYWRCMNCHQFLDAVEKAEIEAGCPPSSALPPLEQMYESIRDGDDWEARKYFKKAAVLYPTLKTSGYLGRLWNYLFV